MTEHASMHTVTLCADLAATPGTKPYAFCLENKHQYSWDGTNWIEFPNNIDITAEIAAAIAEVEGGVPVWGTVTGVLSAQTDLNNALTGKEPANANLQAHVAAAHAPSNATANSSDATLLARANHTGTQSADTLTDGSTNKAFLATERTKLSGIATSATANSTDATLLARANHTGTQAVGTITGLGSLATQNGTFSGTSSGTNTGDQDLSALAPKASPVLTGAPAIAAATGTSLAVSGAITSSGGGIGYTAGNGGTVTQATSKATGVTLNKLCGTITMHNAALAAGVIVSFIVTNSQVAATDYADAKHVLTGAIGGYTVMANTEAAGSFRISVRNNTAGSLSEAIVIRFIVIKAVIT